MVFQLKGRVPDSTLPQLWALETSGAVCGSLLKWGKSGVKRYWTSAWKYSLLTRHTSFVAVDESRA